MNRPRKFSPWSCPDSTLVLPVGVDREEWLRERRNGIGGSDVSAIFGFNPYASGYGVWLDKKGLGTPDAMNSAMRWGKLLEPAMRTAFAEDTGIEVRQCGLMRSRTLPIMQCTPDGLTADGGLFESKTTSGWKSDEWSDGQVPDHAELQVQHGLAVTGRSHAWVVGLIDGRDFQVRRVDRDDKLIANLWAMEAEWWETYIVGDTPPPVTAASLPELKDQFRDVDPDAVDLDPDEVAPLVERLEDAKKALKAAETAKAEAEAALRVKIGPNESATVDGEPFATLKANGTFSPKKFTEEYPDLAAEYQTTKPVLDTARLQLERPLEYSRYRARVLRIQKPTK